VEQEFAQQAYVAAMAAYDAALAEGRQQSRYLAAHVEPTLAERADYPQRWTLTLLTALFASWPGCCSRSRATRCATAADAPDGPGPGRRPPAARGRPAQSLARST
jgi:hypothetical protein